jgi:hypothetical protein
MMNKNRRLVKERFGVKQDVVRPVLGVLGDGAGVVVVPGRTNYVYVRIGDTVTEVFNIRVAPNHGQRVMCGYDPLDPSIFQVLSLQGATVESSGLPLGGSGYAPASRYRWMADGGGEDPLFVELRQFMPVRMGPGSGVTVDIYPGFVHLTSGSWVQVEATSFDLSTEVPTTADKAVLVLVYIDGDGDPAFLTGSEVDYADLVLSDLPEPPAAAEYVLGAVRLVTGQTGIREGRSNTDIVDLRFPMFHKHNFGELVFDGTAINGGINMFSYGSLVKLPGTITIVDDSKHNAFPVLLQLNNGVLAVFYKQATSHAYDADSVVLMRTSDDYGATWSSATTVASDDTYDIQIGGGIIMRSGRIVLGLGLNSISPEGSMANSARVIYSDDDGATWSSYRSAETSFSDWDHFTGSNFVELANGTLLMGLFGQNTDDTYQSAVILKSENAGATWDNEMSVANGETDSRNYQEPNLLVMPSGEILLFLRSDTSPIANSKFYLKRSYDNGETWGESVELFVATGAPRVLLVSNGAILVIYRSVIDNQTDYRISLDGGYHWSDAVRFSSTASVQMAYASAVEMLPGLIGVALAEEDSDTNSDLYFNQMYAKFEGGQFVSHVPDGIEPLVVESSTAVSNLNVDMVDGYHANDLIALVHSGELLVDDNMNILFDDSGDVIYE